MAEIDASEVETEAEVVMMSLIVEEVEDLSVEIEAVTEEAVAEVTPEE